MAGLLRNVPLSDAQREVHDTHRPLVVLAGNPNTGKTTLFNRLTGNRGRVGNLPGVTVETRNLHRRPVTADELRGGDLIVFDPPRAGAKAQAAEIAESGVPVVVAVSCNPATFARDARLLVDGGYRITRIKPVDQFLWSPHLELAAVFVRDG